MPLTGTLKVPGIGAVPKKGAVYGTAAIVVIGGAIWWYRKHHATPATAATGAAGGGMVTDPAGNTCSAVNPATGFCPGTAEDQAAQQGSGFNTSQLGVGGLGGYYYGSGGSVQQSPPGPGNFADNAEWSQYVIGYLTQNLNANPGPLGEALGAYLQGQPVDHDQDTLIEEAIAVGGRPPRAGARGYPPSIRLEPAHKPRPKPRKVKVPDVTQKTWLFASAILEGRGLKARREGTGQAVVRQDPRAGAESDRGDTVTLHMGAFGAQPEG